MRAYVEGSDDPEAELADREVLLPNVAVGERIQCRGMQPKSHTTQPPNRYSEATLTRSLEEMGIGRPSTYAAIIETILDREYVFKRSNVLVPTWVAFAVSQLLEQHLPDLVDYQFTAEMEDELDAISRGEAAHQEYLTSFYYGNAHPGLKQQLQSKADEVNARDVSRVFIGKPEGTDPNSEPIYVRVGRYGPFVEQGERRASIPDRTAPDELTVPIALEATRQGQPERRASGRLPRHAQAVFLKIGRFGPYVQPRHRRGRREAAERLAAERNDSRADRPRDRPAAFVAASHLGKPSAIRRAGRRPQWPIWTLCQEWPGNAILARGPSPPWT